MIEDLFRQLFLASPTPHAITDRRTGEFVDVNDAYLRAFGFSRDEVIGRTSVDLGILRSAESRDEFVERALRDQAEVDMFDRAGEPRTFLVRFVPLRQDGQDLLIGALQDVTSFRRVENALRAAHDTFRHLVENSPFGVYAVDADFRLVQVSAGAQKVFENVRPLIGRDFGDVLRTIWTEPFASEVIGHFRRTLETGEPYHAAATVERRRDIEDVEAYDWKIERITLPDGRLGAVCHFYDLSERQRYEAELREKADQIEEADRRKSEFLAILSHELRNPLAPIRTGIYLLEHAAPDTEQAARARAVIRRQTDHLTRLVDDLLDVTRISRGKVDLKREPLDLRDVVQKTADDVREMYQQSGIELRVEHAVGPVWITADRTRISQIVWNLLQNSLKFTPTGGLVTVDIASRSGQAELTVRDNGLGIVPDEVDRMFEPFAQADQALARTTGGLGLGLALVRGLVELHGGSVGARSEGAGRGAEFTVLLPLSEAGHAVGPQERHDGRSVARVIVVIEDNADAGLILEDMLSFQGYQVHVARDGRTGVRLAQTVRPDVVLCDIGLPDMDGYEVARALRADGSQATLRLIALSGYAQAEDRERAREAGFDLHLAKPPNPDELFRALDAID